MARIYANDAVRIKLKKIINATGIMDGHAHHNSGATCPLPLIYTQVMEAKNIDVSDIPWAHNRESMELLISTLYSEGVKIQKMSTFDMGNHLARLNKLTYANIVGSMDFADEFAKRQAGARISTPLVIATMDMERAHIAGYDGQTIYHEEDGKLFYFKRSSGAKAERDGKKIDLSYEIIENKGDKSKVLKLKKWAIQFEQTWKVACANPLHMLPLYFFDPRRFNRASGTVMPKIMEYGAWDKIFDYIATDTKSALWFGIKMYPSLGHKPFDELCEYLPEFYHRCQKAKIPILTHCSPGGMTSHEAEFYREFDHHNSSLHDAKKAVQYKKLLACLAGTGLQPSQAKGAPVPWGESADNKERFDMDYFFKYYVHPEAWRPVLENFPDLHINLAHFGGAEWTRGPLNEWDKGPASEWVKSIVDMTKKFKYCYTDISCFNLDAKIINEEHDDRTVRTTFNLILHWVRDKEEYKHLRDKVIFGTDWYLTHLTRSDEGAEYGNYCREFKRMIDQVDPTFWIRFTLVNPWTCYSITKEKLQNMKEALCDAGADEIKAQKALDKLLALDDEVTRIKGQLEQWDK